MAQNTEMDDLDEELAQLKLEFSRAPLLADPILFSSPTHQPNVADFVMARESEPNAAAASSRSMMHNSRWTTNRWSEINPNQTPTMLPAESTEHLLPLCHGGYWVKCSDIPRAWNAARLDDLLRNQFGIGKEGTLFGPISDDVYVHFAMHDDYIDLLKRAGFVMDGVLDASSTKLDESILCGITIRPCAECNFSYQRMEEQRLRSYATPPPPPPPRRDFTQRGFGGRRGHHGFESRLRGGRISTNGNRGGYRGGNRGGNSGGNRFGGGNKDQRQQSSHQWRSNNPGASVSEYYQQQRQFSGPNRGGTSSSDGGRGGRPNREFGSHRDRAIRRESDRGRGGGYNGHGDRGNRSGHEGGASTSARRFNRGGRGGHEGDRSGFVERAGGHSGGRGGGRSIGAGSQVFRNDRGGGDRPNFFHHNTQHHGDEGVSDPMGAVGEERRGKKRHRSHPSRAQYNDREGAEHESTSSKNGHEDDMNRTGDRKW